MCHCTLVSCLSTGLLILLTRDALLQHIESTNVCKDRVVGIIEANQPLNSLTLIVHQMGDLKRRGSIVLWEEGVGYAGRQDEAIADISPFQAVASHVYIFFSHSELLDDGPNLMPSTEFKHASVRSTIGHKGSQDSDLLSNDGHVRNPLHVLVRDREGDYLAIGRHDFEVRSPIHLSIGRDEEVVDRFDTLQLGVGLCRHELRCTQLHGLFSLALGGRENHDVSAHGLQVLNG